MDFVRIDATVRSERGKGPNKRLRREGFIPAVAYGRGSEPTALTVSPKELVSALRSRWGRNSVLEISIDGGDTFPALIADYSYHPITRKLTHVDFLRVDLNEPVEVEVPLECVGKAQGVIEGGTLRQVFRTLPIRVLPSAIPAAIEFDVTPLQQNDTVKVEDLNVPEGAEILLPKEQTVLAIVAAQVEAEAAEGAEEEGEEGAAASAEKSSEEKAEGGE